MILLSTDPNQQIYDSRASDLFEEYGGGDWPSILLDGGFTGALHFGDFGYGIVVVDANGVVRAIAPHNIEKAVAEAFDTKNAH